MSQCDSGVEIIVLVQRSAEIDHVMDGFEYAGRGERLDERAGVADQTDATTSMSRCTHAEDRLQEQLGTGGDHVDEVSGQCIERARLEPRLLVRTNFACRKRCGMAPPRSIDEQAIELIPRRMRVTAEVGETAADGGGAVAERDSIQHRVRGQTAVTVAMDTGIEWRGIGELSDVQHAAPEHVAAIRRSHLGTEAASAERGVTVGEVCEVVVSRRTVGEAERRVRFAVL
ncbi:MAG TPA: hypothetical protein VHZ95_02310, partial [Polyangiales bacterium]|nr:hypothetical protein [Polyangiales bacterium]